MSEQIKPIKTPVRYYDGSDFYGNPCIKDADGRHVCEISAWQYNWPAQGGKDTDEITPEHGHAVGNQIADAINAATREPVGADDVIDLLKVPLGKSINITVEDNDEKLVTQNRSQFDNCPGCNNFWDLEMVNCTMDDPEFIVICRPCGWMARGETIEQAMFNWNRRATRHAARGSQWAAVSSGHVCRQCGFEGTLSNIRLVELFEKHFPGVPVAEMLSRKWIQSPVYSQWLDRNEWCENDIPQMLQELLIALQQFFAVATVDELKLLLGWSGKLMDTADSGQEGE